MPLGINRHSQKSPRTAKKKSGRRGFERRPPHLEVWYSESSLRGAQGCSRGAEAEHIRAAAAAEVEAAREEARRLRDEARSDHQTLRAQYAEQLADIQRHADERVAALNQALELARDTAAAYRVQIAAPRPENS